MITNNSKEKVKQSVDFAQSIIATAKELGITRDTLHIALLRGRALTSDDKDIEEEPMLKLTLKATEMMGGKRVELKRDE